MKKPFENAATGCVLLSMAGYPIPLGFVIACLALPHRARSERALRTR